MARAFIAVFVILFAAPALAADSVGKVKICAADGPATAELREMLPDGLVVGGDGVMISIPAKSLPTLNRGECATVRVVLSGGQRPATGAKWSKDVLYHTQLIHASAGTSEDVTKNATVTAEVVEDFVPVQEGKIKVCRTPGIVSMTDGKPVAIPAGTYTGATDKRGNSRSFEIAADGATLGAGKHACVTLAAKVLRGDGAPIKAGERLDAQWVVTGFEPRATVITSFK